MTLACLPCFAYESIMDMQTPPAAQSDDGDDVRWALETANAVWSQGDRRAALSWIRRAAEAAAESGADGRALHLARAGAELRSALEIPRTLPPPAAVPREVVPADSSAADSAAEEFAAESAAAQSVAPTEPKKRVRHHAVRVAVTLSPDHDGAFLAWPLKPKEAPPPNAHEALFIATDPDADLFIFKG